MNAMTSTDRVTEALKPDELVKEAILEWWGERCPDFDAECRTCLAWQFFDSRTLSPSPAPVVGDFVMVPKEPTPAMIHAFRKPEGRHGGMANGDFQRSYRAMLRAALQSEPPRDEKVKP